MRTRKYGKPDRNQADIVAALRKVGARVEIISGQGGGVPDLLVGWPGKNILMECKMPREKLTKDEEMFHALWPVKIYIVETPEEALDVIFGCKTK